MNMRQLLQRKSRGVTPVIATILLIGLVVIAGIAVAVVMFGTINTPAPMKVEILGISDFETTDSNVLVDQFSVTIHNAERSNVRIESDAFTMELLDETPIEGWTMDPDQAIYLSSREITTISLICDPVIGDQLLPGEDTIFIHVKVFPKDSTNERSAQTFSSDLLSVGNTIGPIFLDYQVSTLNLGAAGLDINFTLTNNGSADQELELELYTDSPESITFMIDGVNRTTVSFSLEGFNPAIRNCTIFPTASAVVDDLYGVSAFLWGQEGLGLFAIVSFTLVYQG
ncbi:MAG: type IV pilin N-terminal domain-containing protein [Candidatus Heimdallarchaeota archaeon]|nr:MAG: type IV pilin N-terminal domain-containing protein [Candidatus Heimdallarchaeota archaeon]